MDNLATILIILSIIGFILWVFLHRDNESTAKQIYLTLQDIKSREQEVIQDMLPRIITDNVQIAQSREYLHQLKAKINKYNDSDIEKMQGQQIGNLLTGHTALSDAKKQDTKLKSLHKRLSTLKSEMMDSQLENMLNEYFRRRQGIENVTIGYKVMSECFILDMEFIEKMTKIIRRGVIELQGIEKRIVGILSEYVKKALPQREEGGIYGYERRKL